MIYWYYFRFKVTVQHVRKYAYLLSFLSLNITGSLKRG